MDLSQVRGTKMFRSRLRVLSMACWWPFHIALLHLKFVSILCSSQEMFTTEIKGFEMFGFLRIVEMSELWKLFLKFELDFLDWISKLVACIGFQKVLRNAQI